MGNPTLASFVHRTELEMPETMPAVGVPAILLMLAVFLAILATWIGVVLRLAFGLPVLPPRTPRYVPWGAGSVVLAIVFWLGLQFSVPTAYIAVAYPRQPGVPTPRPDLGPAEQMTLSAISNAIALIFIPLIIALTSGARPADFGMSTRGFFRQVYRGMVTYPILAPIVFGAMLGSLLIWKKTPHPLEDAIKLGHDPALLVILVLAGVVFAPLAEELIFRGILLGWLTRLVIGPEKKTKAGDGLEDLELPEPVDNPFGEDYAASLDLDPNNPYAPPLTKLEPPEPVEQPTSPTRITLLVLANVFVSLVFAALHSAVWPTPIPIFFLSLGLGLLYQRTGSLIPSMALHMTFNGVSTVLMLLTLGNGAPKDEVKPPVVLPKVEARPAVVDKPGF